MIQAQYQIPITSPGGILREERKLGTTLGVEAEKFTIQGQLVPDAVVNGVVKEWLSRHGQSFIFDGYPRSLGQAIALDEMLAERETPLDAVVLLETNLQTIRDRVARRRACTLCGRIVSVDVNLASASSLCPSCGGELSKRPDDTPETLELRMHEYTTKTVPLLDYYRCRMLLYPLNGAQSPEIVFASIVNILEES
jgi:adenylate kinase